MIIVFCVLVILCIPFSQKNFEITGHVDPADNDPFPFQKREVQEHISDEGKEYKTMETASFKGPSVDEDNGKTTYRSHLLTQEEVEDMKNTIGVRDMNKNYNTIIDGHGTGLAPPTEEEWERMIGRIEVVDGLQEHSTPRLPKEPYGSGLNEDMEDSMPGSDVTPTREKTKATVDIQYAGLSTGPTTRGIGVGLPTSVDHSSSNYFPAVGNQDGQGSCAAWATTYYAQGFLQAKDNGWNQAHLGNPAQLMSPAWTYNKVNGGVDEGSFSWTNGIILQQFGSPTLAIMPYDDTDLISWGSETAWREAPIYKISEFQVTEYQNINVVKSWIKDGYPTIIGIDASEINNWVSGTDYVISSAEYSENWTDGGGHAITVIGYNDDVVLDGDIGAFKIVNSWGTNWGDDGFFWMTYRAFSEMQNGWATRLLDKADYEPELLATWKFSQPGPRDVNITIGIGNPNAPLEQIDLQYAGGSHNFPKFMCMDISNLTGHLGLSEFYLDMDLGSSNSRVSSFRFELYGDYYLINGSIRKSNESNDVPFNTPGTAYNNIYDLHIDIASPAELEYVGNGNIVFTGNSSSSVTETILEEGFEGEFPGDWVVGDSNTSSGQDYWSNSSARALNGSWSGYCAGYKEPVYYEDFNHEGILPQDWATFSEGPDNYPWFSHNDDVPYLYGGDDYGVVSSSYGAGPGTDITEWIYMTQGFDASDYKYLQLEFQMAFLDYDGDESFSILYANSTTYPTFTTVKQWTSTEYGKKSINISDAAGDTQVYLAFIYHGTYDNYVVIDDVVVTSDTAGKYEVGMDAFMYMNVSLTNYDYVNLTYDFWLDCENQCDALYLIFFSGGQWHYVNGFTGQWQNAWWSTWYNIPTTTTQIGFYFYSDVSITNEGAYLDNVVLTGHINRTKVKARIDKGQWSSVIGGGNNWTLTLDSSLYPDGIHNITVASYYGSKYSDTTTSVYFDNTPPQFHSWSNSTALMGHNLYLETSVSDNHRMGNVFLNYSINNGQYHNISLENGSGNLWMKNITLPIDAVEVNLYFWANDSLGNEIRWNNFTILPDDPYSPEIHQDESDPEGNTGDPFHFQADITDNVAVQDVWVEYWFGSGDHHNHSLEFFTVYQGEISIPPNSTEALNYILWAMDSYSNIASTSQEIVSIEDNDRPTIGIDQSPEEAFTGNHFNFCINTYDNIGINTVTVEYWFNDETHSNETMEKQGNYVFDFLLPINFNGTLSYFFSVCDNASNWNVSNIYTRQVMDDDKPTIIEDISAMSGTTGDEYVFMVEPTDNIEVGGISVEYWFGNGGRENTTLQRENEVYTLMINLPYDGIETMHYIFRVWDTMGNFNYSMTKNVSIFDNDAPVSISQGDLSADQNEAITFDGGNSVDNVGIINYSWRFLNDETEITLYEETSTHIFTKVGIYSVTLTVMDMGGNSNSSDFNVTVQDITCPSAKTGKSMIVKKGVEFTLDASNSSDNVGIVNYTWTIEINGEAVHYYGVSPYVIINTPGNFSFRLIVTDMAGNSNSVDFYVIVTESDPDNNDDDEDDDTGNDDTDDDTGDDDTGDDDTVDDDTGNDDTSDDGTSDDEDNESQGFSFGSSTFIIGGIVIGMILLLIIFALVLVLRRKTMDEDAKEKSASRKESITTKDDNQGTSERTMSLKEGGEKGAIEEKEIEKNRISTQKIEVSRKRDDPDNEKNIK